MLEITTRMDKDDTMMCGEGTRNSSSGIADRPTVHDVWSNQTYSVPPALVHDSETSSSTVRDEEDAVSRSDSMSVDLDGIMEEAFRKHKIFDDNEETCRSVASTASLSASGSSSSTVPNGKRRRARPGARATEEVEPEQTGRGRQSPPLHSMFHPFQKLNQAGVTVTPIDEIPYVHQGYAAAAPIMVDDPIWMRVLERLMPGAHKDATWLSQEGDPVKLMKWAENNPVVAAYGVMQGHPKRNMSTRKLEYLQPSDNQRSGLSSSDSTKASKSSLSITSTMSDMRKVRRKKSRVRSRDPNTTAIEWDVFLDPTLVQKVDEAIEVAHNCTEDVQERMVAEIEVDRQVGRLLSRMLLAHGSASQLVREALGVAPRYNFAKVAESTLMRAVRRKSAPCTGIFAQQWLEIFEKALRLGQELLFPARSSEFSGKGKLCQRKSRGRVVNWQKNETSTSLWASSCSLDGTRSLATYDSSYRSAGESVDYVQAADADFVKPAFCGMFLCLGLSDPNSDRASHASNSMSESLKSIKEFLGAPLSIVIDLKSRRVPPRVWARVVDNLRSRGLSVKGVGSFDTKELRDIASHCSTPVTQVMFFHSAGDLQRACHADEIKRGDTVYFNAGSLLWQKPTLLEAADMPCCPAPRYMDVEDHARYVIQPFAHSKSFLEDLPQDLNNISTLEDYQQHYNLNIGLYVQEFSICEEALDLLVNFVNFNNSVFNLGMAWGGLNGATVSGVTGDGFWNQRFLGRNWDLYSGPTDKLELTAVEDNDLVREAIVAYAQAGMANDEEVQEITAAIQHGPCAPGHGHDGFLDTRRGPKGPFSRR